MAVIVLVWEVLLEFQVGPYFLSDHRSVVIWPCRREVGEPEPSRSLHVNQISALLPLVTQLLLLRILLVLKRLVRDTFLDDSPAEEVLEVLRDDHGDRLVLEVFLEPPQVLLWNETSADFSNGVLRVRAPTRRRLIVDVTAVCFELLVLRAVFTFFGAIVHGRATVLHGTRPLLIGKEHSHALPVVRIAWTHLDLLSVTSSESHSRCLTLVLQQINRWHSKVLT